MYPRETVIAEKFEAMVKLGTLNGAAAADLVSQWDDAYPLAAHQSASNRVERGYASWACR
jgi:hypothetical protein